MALDFFRDEPLGPKTTLGVGGPGRYFVRVTSVDELRDALLQADAESEPVLILGGGSNLVIGDAGFAGLVIEMGIERDPLFVDAGDCVDVQVDAGVSWDGFVEQTVGRHLAGCECLSGIPGLVGATPMQNVGAYGQEVSDTITSVHALDRTSGEVVVFTPEQCGFSYRNSVFRGSSRWVIVRVDFRFDRSELSKPIQYAELSKSLGIPEGASAALASVRERVIALRRGKGMVVDPRDPDSRSAGSFFTNPIVDPAVVSTLQAQLAVGTAIPTFSAPGGMVKLSAAWLIEKAGFTKGFTRGRAGISTKHALALVNRGGATAGELLALAKEIQDGVRERLGIDLHPEPVIV